MGIHAGRLGGIGFVGEGQVAVDGHVGGHRTVQTTDEKEYHEREDQRSHYGRREQ